MHNRLGLLPLALVLALGAVACGDDEDMEMESAGADSNTNDNTDGTDNNNNNNNNNNSNSDSGAFATVSCAEVTGPCGEFEATDTAALLTAVNSLVDDTTIVLGEGTFELNVGISIVGVSGITLIGQGMDETTLDFSGQTVEGDGVSVVSDDFRIEGLMMLDSVGDALRVEDSTGVVIRGVRATWTNAAETDNGDYGLYPVKCTNVLMEDSEASNAADAGIYIGQSQNVILRDNTATANVAGIEIENTQFADVFDNTATGNTAGIVVFDLPGNPIVGRDVRIHDNTITGNNGVNFATPGSVVSQIPPGVGSFILASRRVEFFDNTYENNNTSDIAVLSGLAIESDPAAWAIPKDESVGSTDGLNLMETDDTLAFLNFRTEQILIRDNTFGPGGTSPSGTALQPIGALLTVIYGDEPVDSIIYDTLGETSFSATDAEGNSNDNVLCIDNNTGAEFGSINLQAQQMALDTDNPPVDFYRPAAPFAPFDCDALAAGPVEAVTLP